MSTTDGRAAEADEQLMAQARYGDQAAFARVFERHRTVVLAIAARVAGSANADDVAQVAYLAAWNARHSYDERRGSPRTWLLTIVRHRAIDAYRRDRTRRPYESHAVARGDQRLEDVHGRPEVTLIQRDEARRVREALDLLPADQRQVLELAYLEGLTHTQIAAQLAIPLGTVKGRLRLGLSKLAGRLDDAVSV